MDGIQIRKYFSRSASENIYPDPEPPYKRFPTQGDPNHVRYCRILLGSNYNKHNKDENCHWWGAGNMLFFGLFSRRKLWIQEFLLCRKQYCGSVTFRYGSGSGDPYLWVMDPNPAPDPAIFVSDVQDGNKFFFFGFLIFGRYPVLFEEHSYHFSKIKFIKKSQNRRIQGFSYYFCWW